MKSKYPQSVWLVFDKSSKEIRRIFTHPDYWIAPDRITRRYIPADEVARTLNALEDAGCFISKGQGLGTLEAGWIVKSAGFKVRWDSKRGRFVS